MPSRGRSCRGFDAIAALPQVTLVPLDLTNGRSVSELAGAIGGKVDIVVNNAEVHRTSGRGEPARHRRGAGRDGHQLLRAAAPGAGVRPGAEGPRRRWPEQRHRLGEPAVDLRLEQLSLARHLLGLEGRRAFAGAMPARRDAAGRHPRAQRLPRSDRRRMEPADARRQRWRRPRWPRPSSRPCATAWKTCTPATWRRNGWHAGATTRRCWNANSRQGAACERRRDPERPGRRAARRADPGHRPDADADAGVPADRAAAGVRPVLALPHRGGVASTTSAAPAGTGTTSPAASTPARTSTRRSTGSPAATCRTTRWTPSRCGHFVAPAVVIDCSAQAAADPDYLLTVDAVRAWEQTHGRIPAGSWVLMRTDWSKRSDPEAYQNFDETGQHTPGPDAEAPASWSSSATCSASAARPSAPTPARATTCARRTPATTSCTARGATGCSA